MRTKFQGFAPDLDDYENPGLTVASNVVHDAEGYKPVTLDPTFTATLSGVTVASVMPVGAQGDYMAAWVDGNTLNVGINAVAATTTESGYPLTFSITPASFRDSINFFDVCELNNNIYFVVQATRQDQQDVNINETLNMAGYMPV